MKNVYYRDNLGRHIGKRITVVSDDIEIKVNEEGTYLILLKYAAISRVNNNKKNVDSKNNQIHHIWVRVSKETAFRLRRAKKISVSGTVYLYTYKGKNEKNVGINADSVHILKPIHFKRKDKVIEPVEFHSFTVSKNEQRRSTLAMSM